MGTKCAPTFANIFMGSLEEDFLNQTENLGNPMPLLWLRYIDDILVIWPHSKSEFFDFFNQLNDYHPTIKYTYELSDQKINFLDITIFKGKRFLEQHILDLAPFFKSTNKMQYLHFDSCHPPHTFKGLILGEAIRMLRASSDPTIYADTILTIKKALLARKYPPKLIDRTLKKIKYNDRLNRLQHYNTKKPFPGTGCADLRIPFNPKKPPNRVQAALPILTNNQPIRSVLTYSKNKHVSNFIVSSLVKGAPTTKITNICQQQDH